MGALSAFLRATGACRRPDLRWGYGSQERISERLDRRFGDGELLAVCASGEAEPEVAETIPSATLRGGDRATAPCRPYAQLAGARRRGEPDRPRAASDRADDAPGARRAMLRTSLAAGKSRGGGEAWDRGGSATGTSLRLPRCQTHRYPRVGLAGPAPGWSLRGLGTSRRCRKRRPRECSFVQLARRSLSACPAWRSRRSFKAGSSSAG